MNDSYYGQYSANYTSGTVWDFHSGQRLITFIIRNGDFEQKVDNSIQANTFHPNMLKLSFPRKSIVAYDPPVNDKLPVISKGPVFCLCMGYVATGYKHNDRAPAHIVLVNE